MDDINSFSILPHDSSDKHNNNDMSEKLLGDDHNNINNVIIDEEQQQEQNILVVNENNSSNNNINSGEKQPNQYRDVWAAILFLSAQIVIMYLAFAWGIPALNYDYSNNSNSSSSYHSDDDYISFTGILWLSICSSIIAMIISGLALGILIRVANQLIQISLGITIICDLFMVIFFILQGLIFASIASLVFLLITILYAWTVWRRIPFAASTLQTAVTAIQNNMGLLFVSYGLTAIVNLYSILWILAWLGVYVRSADCTDTECTSHMNPIVIILFLLMFYWTTEVGKNILHVTTSGVVGTFWFVPEDASSFCSPAVYDSLVRASTYSLGSICLGSLLTAILQVMHHIAHSARRHGRRNEIFLCILECIIGFLERLIAYFNKWAYVYIGLYGYDYLTAGHKVTSLFLERGWTAIINDNLVLRALTLVCLVIGALTGCVGILLASAKPTWVDQFGDAATLTAFLIPAMIGTAMAYILISVLASAVDTVVVAFAEAPLEFERNHPGLSTQMVTAWRQVYPEEFGR